MRFLSRTRTLRGASYESFLDEFDKGGMIHISDVSPGRIRNIRDFVKEDKIVVCQVLRVSRERGYIDLSLRRVNDNQKRKKLTPLHAT